MNDIERKPMQLNTIIVPEEGQIDRPIPDRLCADKNSQFHIADCPLVRISVDGIEFTGRVLEYCISSGWAMVLKVDKDTGDPIPGKKGRPSFTTKRGKVVVWWGGEPVPPGAIAEGSPVCDMQYVFPTGETAPRQDPTKKPTIQ